MIKLAVAATITFVISVTFGFAQIKKYDEKAQLLLSNLATPEKELYVTFQFGQVLKKDEISKIKYPDSVKFTTVFIGEMKPDGFHGGNQPAYGNDTPLTVLERFKSDMNLALVELERTKPSPEITFPNFEDYGVYGFTVKGRTGEILKLMQTEQNLDLLDVTEDSSKTPLQLSKEQKKGSELSESFSLDRSINRRILPNEGRFSAYENSAGKRVVVNWFFFNTREDLSGFFNDDAYEHQTVLNKRDGSVYLGPVSTSLSNMPSYYLDSTDLNNQGIGGTAQEPDWSMGTYKASQLQTGVWYYTAITCDKGNADKDTAKLSVQAIQTYCSSSPWCVTGNRKDTQFIRTAWDISIPTSFSWKRSNILDADKTLIPAGRDTEIILTGTGFSAPFGARVKIGNTTYPIHWGAQTRYINPNQVGVKVNIANPYIDFTLWVVSNDGNISNQVKGFRSYGTIGITLITPNRVRVGQGGWLAVSGYGIRPGVRAYVNTWQIDPSGIDRISDEFVWVYVKMNTIGTFTMKLENPDGTSATKNFSVFYK
ncbi:MAG: hypothetical protein ABR566_17015 [Pyrinomonadaceae bacterium]